MSLQDILKNYRLFINFSRSMKSYNIERTTWFSFLVFIGAFFAMYRPTLQAAKRTRGKSGNPAEVATCYGEYPKARIKLTRSGPVTDEGPASDTEFQLRNRGNKWGMIRIACC